LDRKSETVGVELVTRDHGKGIGQNGVLTRRPRIVPLTRGIQPLCPRKIWASKGKN